MGFLIVVPLDCPVRLVVDDRFFLAVEVAICRLKLSSYGGIGNSIPQQPKRG